jgi:YbgC/YbaW family acyl-CoA thioester hydrolase
MLAAMGASISLRRRLDWSDTDAAGYWHHSTFWKFAEAGEAELARSTGLSDLMFGYTPRRSVSAEFHRPVFFDDELTITFTVEAVGRTSATYSITVTVDDGLAAEGKLIAVLVDDEGRPRPWPAEAAALLAGSLN